MTKTSNEAQKTNGSEEQKVSQGGQSTEAKDTAAPAEPSSEAGNEIPTTIQQANADGAILPETAPVSEDVKAGTAKRVKKDKMITFRTRNQDDIKFTFMGMRPFRDAGEPRHWFWRMDEKLGKKARDHHHLKTGRIVEVKD